MELRVTLTSLNQRVSPAPTGPNVFLCLPRLKPGLSFLGPSGRQRARQEIPSTSVILGASKVAQLEENLLASAAAEKLSPELMAQIDEIMGTKPKESSNADNH